jgi:hypothetical protein
LPKLADLLEKMFLSKTKPSFFKASEGILLRDLGSCKSCEARQHEAGWWARQQPYEVAFLEKFLSLSKMLVHRVPTEIPTK